MASAASILTRQSVRQHAAGGALRTERQVAQVAGVGRQRTITQPNGATLVHEWLRSPRGGDAGGGDHKAGAAKSWAHFDIPPKGGVKAKSIASALVWRAYCSHIPATACAIAPPRQLPRRSRASDECHDCANRRRRPCGFGPALRCLEDLAAVRAILAAAMAVRHFVGANSDVSWEITLSEKILDGQRLYTDLIEINPPASTFLYLPAVPWRGHLA
jgi:hypothetical protein